MKQWWDSWNPDDESLEECRDRRFLMAPVLNGAELDTLLACRKITADGDVPSKSGRDSLYEKELIVRWNGYQVATRKGMALLEIMGKLHEMDRMKLTGR
jgi:hypothetical protein